MAKDTKKTKEPVSEFIQQLLALELSEKQQTFYHEKLRNWHICLGWPRETEDPDALFEAISYEIQNGKRPAFLDRLRTRYNKVRAFKELKAIESHLGVTINVNYV